MAFDGFACVNFTFCADFQAADTRGGDGVAVHELAKDCHCHGDYIFTIATVRDTFLLLEIRLGIRLGQLKGKEGLVCKMFGGGKCKNGKEMEANLLFS
jgi:hypothetical protein